MTAEARTQYSVADLMGKMSFPAGLLEDPAGTAPPEADDPTPNLASATIAVEQPVRKAKAKSTPAAAAPVAVPAAVAPAVARPDRGAPAVTADDTRARGRSVRVDRSVEVLLAVASAVTGRSYTDLALGAVEEHYLHAETLGVSTVPAGSGGGLFPRRVPKLVAPNRVLISLYLTDSELEIVDGIASDAGLTRSELVNRCARAALAKRVFCPVEALLRLQATGTPAAALGEWVTAVSGSGVPAPALPGKPDGWTELPGEWVEATGDAFDAAQLATSAGSWTEVAWAAFTRFTS